MLKVTIKKQGYPLGKSLLFYSALLAQGQVIPNKDFYIN